MNFSSLQSEMDEYFRSPIVDIDNTKRLLFIRFSAFFLLILMVFKY